MKTLIHGGILVINKNMKIEEIVEKYPYLIDFFF